ncbi:hypothetical protein D3C85_1178590 [compost metagenome]
MDRASSAPEGVPPFAASSGIIATKGIAAMSWKSKTAKLLRPTAVEFMFRSLMACMAIAVEDRLNVSPTNSAAVQFKPSAAQNIAMAAPHTSICSAPPPNTMRRIAQRRLGSSSRPMMKSINTTPISAKCRMDSTSVTSLEPHGPIRQPAIK